MFAVARDDIAEPTYAQRAAEILDARPEVGISVCRREAWEAVGGHSNPSRSEDYGFWLRVLDRGGICVSIDEPLYRHRIHPGRATSTTTWEDKLQQQLTIVRRNPDIWARHIDVVMESH